MDNERIQAALRDASDTHSVVIGAGTLAAVDSTFAQCFQDSSAVIVADEHTFGVAGGTVYEGLRANGRTVEEPIIFPGAPTLYADFNNVLQLEDKLRAFDAIPVVVGSGTLNDITKLAAHRAGRPYMCVGTAASMDGYTAFGAAITKDGFKQTMSCAAPRALLADLDILAHAPAQMNSTGYGDLLGKVTAGADWMLADALEIEPIDPQAWALVQDSLRTWTGEPARLHAGDPQVIEYLFEGLIMAGVAMQISQSSRPASGSEHRFSHLWEMQALGHGHPAIPHGFKVGVGSIAGATLYERVLARDFTTLDIDGLCRDWPSRAQLEQTVRQGHDIPQLADNAVEESLAKYITVDQLRQRLHLLQERWPALRPKLQAQLMTAAQLRDLLAAAGCPTEPAAVGVDLAQLRESYWLARTIRSRYTVLDLVYETGILDACLDELFAPGGYWE
ncbi:MAG: sn-glycerol-1-phosphate dehydrogenase [Herpetosiphonaceae bacterium]|nr:sn-glycerol-1-phosphate dehydrogenase [Herpetosiphonaceae bacterium]